MGAGGQSRHVVHLGALVVHVRQQQRRHVPVEGRCKFITLDEPKLDVGAEHAETLRHVQVGREVSGLAEDDPPPGPRFDRGGQELVEIDRGGVRHDHLAGACADQRGDLVADPPRRADPVVEIPTAYEIDAPFLLGKASKARGRALRKRAETVPVQIDDAVGNQERVPHRPQRIGGVPGAGFLQAHSAVLTDRSSGKKLFFTTCAR